MVVDSPLPRDYRTHCRLFSAEKLDEQYHRHTRGSEAGCRTSAACLREVRQELLRRQTPGYKRLPKTYEELKQRRAERRAKRLQS